MYTVKLHFNSMKILVNINTNIPENVTSPIVARHSNLHHELHIILGGKCIIDIDDIQVKLSQRQAIIVSPGKFHSIKDISDDFIHFVIPFEVKSEDDTAKMLKEQMSEIFIINLSDFDLNICKKIITEIIAKNIFWQESVFAMYSMFFTSFLRNFNVFSKKKISSNVENINDRFSIIDNFFETNLSHNCTEDDLSQQVNLSKRQLNRVLIMNYGMGFREKMHNSRMDTAKWLLRTTNLSIGKICEKIGYSTDASFYKSFKKHFKTTPREYRDKYYNK